MANIEQSFNEIWKVRQSRNMFRRLTDYLGLLLFGSLCLILAGGLTVFSTSKLPELLSQFGLWRFTSPAVGVFLKVLPYFLMWVMFTMLYLIAPNTRVQIRAALAGGIVAGTAYQVLQWLYIRAQIGVSHYDTVYGSVAALPLLIMWMQTSWMLVLFGAELSYGVQHAKGFYPDEITRALSPRHRKLLTLLVAHVVIKEFARGQKPPKENQIGDLTGVPLGLVRELSNDLVTAGVLVPTAEGRPGNRLYYPALDVHELTIQRVVDRLDGVGKTVVPVILEESWRRINDAYQEGERLFSQSPSNSLLSDL
jgi:membrane protein